MVITIGLEAYKGTGILVSTVHVPPSHLDQAASILLEHMTQEEVDLIGGKTCQLIFWLLPLLTLTCLSRVAETRPS